MYDNDILQQIIDTATELQNANNEKIRADNDLQAAQTHATEVAQVVTDLNAELDRLTGKTTTVPSRIRR